MDHQNIDRLFREKLDKLETQPSANAWSQVNKQIRPKKTPIIYWVAASITLLLISWIVWPTSVTTQFTPLASEVNHPVQTGNVAFILPEIKDKKEVKQETKQPVRRTQSQLAVVTSIKAKAESVEEVPVMEIESKNMVAEVDIDQPNQIIEEVKEAINKPEFRTVKITYIASSNSNTASEVQKTDSTGVLKKFIAFAEKIDPGDMLADIKTAKDNLLNGGFKDKKDRNSL